VPALKEFLRELKVKVSFLESDVKSPGFPPEDAVREGGSGRTDPGSVRMACKAKSAGVSARSRIEAQVRGGTRM
jgi:hypothetical protein